ncbi:MAG: thymidine phosphorylase [Bradymonadales bacterium]|nr:MAG: thymidine phosphorylase [Bradymonadales bacterium]
MTDLRPLIFKKQNEEAFTPPEIHAFVKSLNSKEPPPDEQIASLLAFIFCRGMNKLECFHLMNEMRLSGDQIRRDKFPADAYLMDKHSTGGVGDKISLPLVPLVAACSEEIYIPMIAGRGLGHTGGTIDKLESIPGCRTRWSAREIETLLKRERACFAAQSEKMAPADRVLYALRDITGTVASIPLVVSSILSKKLSESLDYLLLDLKYGDGAFFPEAERSEELGGWLVEIAREAGVVCDLFQTAMQAPLGDYSGNLLEILETELILQGDGPSDSTQLSREFAKAFLQRSGIEEQEAESRIQEKIRSGEALRYWERMIKAQGGNLSKLRAKLKSLKQRLKRKRILAPQSGYLHWKSKALGWSLVALGGGRRRATDRIQAEVGLFHPLKEAEFVEKGQSLLEIYHLPTQSIEEAEDYARSSYEIREESFSAPPLIRKVWRDEHKLSTEPRISQSRAERGP